MIEKKNKLSKKIGGGGEKKICTLPNSDRSGIYQNQQKPIFENYRALLNLIKPENPKSQILKK